MSITPKNIKSKKFYDSSDEDLIKDTFVNYYKSGNVKLKYTLINQKFDDSFIVYYENGNIKRQDYFELGKLINGSCFFEDGKTNKYFPYFTKPTYKGGDDEFRKLIMKNFIYPSSLQEKGISGYVLLGFYVNVNGQVEDITALEGNEPLFINEAIRVLKLGNWIPAMEDGLFYKSYRTLPITLQISD